MPNNTEETRALVKALLKEDGLVVRFYPSDPGSRNPLAGLGKVYYCPDPKGSKIILPLALKDSPYIRYQDRMGDDSPCDASRFRIGPGYNVRVVWSRDKDCMCINLPTDPGASPYIIWFDFEEEGRLEAAEWVARNAGKE